MSEYISKKNAREIILNQPSRYDMLENVKSAPPADVRENIHGHWEPKYPTREEMIYCQERYFCSNCKNYIVDRIARLEFNFCPNCGADMREPKGEKGET